MSDQHSTISRRRILHGLGAVGLGGALSACVGPTITSRGSGSAAGGAAAQVLPAVNGSPATGSVVLRPLARRGQGRLRHPHRRRSSRRTRRRPSPRTSRRRTTTRAPRCRRSRAATSATPSSPSAARSSSTWSRPGCMPAWAPSRSSTATSPSSSRPGQATSRAQMGPALPAGLQHAHLQRGRLRPRPASTSTARGLGRLPRALREAQGEGLRPDRVAGRRAGQLGPAHQLDGHEQHAHRHGVRRHRGRHAQGHRRLVPADPQAVPAAGAVLRAQLDRHGSEPLQQLFASGKAAMLATGSFHIGAVRKLGAKFPIGLIAPITVAADKAKYEGIYNATFILGVNTAGTRPGRRPQVAAVPLRPRQRRGLRERHVAARDRQERRLHERRPQAQRALARRRRRCSHRGSSSTTSTSVTPSRPPASRSWAAPLRTRRPRRRRPSSTRSGSDPCRRP